MTNGMYLIGRITSTHGIRGELKVINLSDFDRFKPGKKVFVDIKGKYLPFVIDSVREHKNKLLVKFVDKDNINDVLMYRGFDLYTEEQSDVMLDPDEYYYDDLIGKKVQTDYGEDVGVVSSLIEVPQGHLLEVKKTNGKKVLVPFVSAFVESINDQIIVIKPIEGLL